MKETSFDQYDLFYKSLIDDVWGELSKLDSVASPEKVEDPKPIENMVEDVESNSDNPVNWFVMSDIPAEYQMLEIALPGIKREQVSVSQKDSVVLVNIAETYFGKSKLILKNSFTNPFCMSHPDKIYVMLKPNVEVDRVEHTNGLLRIRLIPFPPKIKQYVVM
jgi:HSP20 family molecular chaperone IbpA